MRNGATIFERMSKNIRSLLALATFLYALSPAILLAETEDEDSFSFDDTPLEELIKYPEWFEESLLALDDELEEALEKDKQGIIVYFGQKRCPYCKKLMDINFTEADIVEYTRRHFDVIPIDVWSPEEVTLPDGRVLSERDYAVELETNFTPSLVFYNSEGRVILRLRGYYPPYQHRAALEYVADGHYRRETFADYLKRGDQTLHFEAGDLIEDPLFEKPPYNLDRRYGSSGLPLLVVFEQGDCHACEVLHTEPLQDERVRGSLNQLEIVQLGIHADTPLVTPSGERTSAKTWAKKLGLFYAPTLIFFDEDGQEIIRVDSVVQLVRLSNVLQYVLSKSYLEEPSFLRWISKTRAATIGQAAPDQSQNRNR